MLDTISDIVTMHGLDSDARRGLLPDQPTESAVQPCDPRLVVLYQRFAVIGACGAIFIAIVTLIGWVTDTPILTSSGPNWIHMKINATLAFLALGLALLLVAFRCHRDPRWRLFILLGIGLAMTIGAASLLEDLFRLDLGVDQWLVAEKGGIETVYPGRMSPLTSVCLLLIGAGLLAAMERSSRFNWLITACSIPTLVISITVLTGYLLGARELYTLAGHTTAVGFHAGLAALLLAIGVKCVKPDHMVFRRLASAGSGGYMLRRLLPLEALAITGIVAIRLWGQRAGLFNSVEFGAALVSVTSIISVGVMLVWCAARLDALDAARTAAESGVVRLNALLTQKLSDLEAANKELEAFSYSVSHDLRTPLRAIDGFSRILSEDYMDKLDNEGRRLIGVVRDGTRKMAQLIDDILAFSRVGRLDMRTARVDMTELVQDVLRELSPAIQGRDVQFVIPSLPPAHGDRVMLRRVWQNLLDNAIKYTSTHDTARIEVGAETVAPETVYYVKDDGVGFDMRYVEKLFGVFCRLHGPSEFSGTGIGLAIVKRIVARHGGRVWAEGALQQGATFRFTLPFKENDNA